MTTKTKPKLLIGMEDSLYSTIFCAEDLRRLEQLADVMHLPPRGRADKPFLLDHLDGAEVAITSWGTAPFDAEVIQRASNLKLVCHAAGTIRPVVSDALWERGIAVTSAAAAISYGVAEFCLAMILTAAKRVYWQAQGTRTGLWAEMAKSFGGGFEIHQQNIGVIGAGHIGRHLIRLLHNFTCNILVYDPFLSADDARNIGTRKVDTLEELFATCRAVSLNAPTNEGARRMLRGSHFAALPPGSVFINTAGSIQIDEPEFVAELRKGRFVACIDRCAQEPCPLDHPYRTLPNVILTPHIAGVMAENRLRIGTHVVDDIERYTLGQPLKHAVTREALARIA
jgi:phosphoglycerate dehydrogenase-like enzyme